MSQLSAIQSVLEKYPNWLNYRSITQEIINDWLYIFGWATPELSVNKTINWYITKEWTNSSIVSLWSGMYIMRKYYNTIDRAKEKPIEIIEDKDESENNQSAIAIESENISNINNNDLDFSVIDNSTNTNQNNNIKENKSSTWNDSGFIGKWWEFAVCTELLFRHFNATIMPVDSWADILATKNNELFNIQVKTANLSNWAYHFFIKLNSFQRYNFTNMYYIFVIIKADKSREYVVIPSFNIQWMIGANQITQWQQWYAIWITYQNSGKITLTNGVDLTHYLNKWSWIDRRQQE